jgi:hypothetical protein
MVTCPSCGELVLLDAQEDLPISMGAQDPELPNPPPGRRVTPPPPPPPPLEDDFNFSVDDIEVVTPNQSPEGLQTREPVIDFPQAEWPAQDAGGLEEIANYGNSEVSQANDGLLMFDVIVEGIDNNEMRTAVREILDDKRFLWNADSLMSSVKNGHLRISKINSIKASLLVKRLKHLDVRIRWEQYAIVQMVRD